MILRKTFLITDWTQWDHQIDSATKEFIALTQKTPNILLANDPTLDRIEFMANQKRQNLRRDEPLKNEDEPSDPNHWRPLGGFQGDGYSLGFCVDTQLNFEKFSLIFDSDPDGDGGEPVPVEDNVLIPQKRLIKRKAA